MKDETNFFSVLETCKLSNKKRKALLAAWHRHNLELMAEIDAVARYKKFLEALALFNPTLISVAQSYLDHRPLLEETNEE